jgi:hypothetical protein
MTGEILDAHAKQRAHDVQRRASAPEDEARSLSVLRGAVGIGSADSRAIEAIDTPTGGGRLRRLRDPRLRNQRGAGSVVAYAIGEPAGVVLETKERLFAA